MLARCSRCESTFVTSQFGRQRCPKCGGEVFVADPMAPAGHPTAAESEAVASEAPVPETESIPWERRKELGFFKGLFGTIKLAITEPSSFFSRMRYDRTEGAHLFFFLVVCLPWIVASFLGWLTTPSPEKQMERIDETMKQLQQLFPGLGGGATPPSKQYEELLRPYLQQNVSFVSFLGSVVGIIVGSFVLLYVSAGVAHLTLMLLGKASGGWNATFKVFVYGFSPGPIIALPACGGIIMFLWAAALQIVGLTKAHRASTFAATLAVISIDLLMVLCCAIPIGAFVILAMRAALNTG